MRVPTGYINEARLGKVVNSALRKLGKEVVWAKYTLGEDWDGDPSIRFRIVLTDAASNEGMLGEVTRRISNQLIKEIRPYEDWGLQVRFNFRSKSEQMEMNDPDWA